MITSTFRYEQGNLKEVTVSGHAHYKAHGKDIVCAAVSATIIVTANAIEHLKLNQFVDLTIDDGYFNIILTKNDPIVLGLLENLEYTFIELKKQYPKYMKNQKEG